MLLPTKLLRVVATEGTQLTLPHTNQGKAINLSVTGSNLTEGSQLFFQKGLFGASRVVLLCLSMIELSCALHTIALNVLLLYSTQYISCVHLSDGAVLVCLSPLQFTFRKSPGGGGRVALDQQTLGESTTCTHMNYIFTNLKCSLMQTTTTEKTFSD